MHVISEKRIWQAKEHWPRAAAALDAWYRLMKGVCPEDFAAMKGSFPVTDKVGDLHVFDIGGNKLRLIAIVRYRSQRIYIRSILDHAQYSKGKWEEEAF
ncbi:type II toxin-antitoxin system HigB family toxin [Pseudomonas eucalypticola]|uniref:Type II toxin-antitoxin system HigB family toxin n=1 Tax=Pseudomonas eucalypticola TaxID=2599595 RepID=A0A7D5HAT2_9PSED|nr:type II toxin-antitoxin system HigB family toxin [Pseudomonas eucalypticola]QKZ02710.1 type II toxin-antitoxin system HigB family toxin [Pseudomonas eucalypticola]